MCSFATSAILAATLAATLPTPGWAWAGATTTTSTGSAAAPDDVCLKSADIAGTTSPDDKTILFHLKDGKVWRNALVTNCPSLSANGFVYVKQAAGGKICGNLQQIQVNNSKQVCILGPFTQDTAKGNDGGS